MFSKLFKSIVHLRNIITKKTHLESSEKYINWLRSKGIKVGKRTFVFSPNCIQIDLQRPELIEIGDDVFLHKGTVIMAHDWAGWTLVRAFHDYIPSHGKIKIGNNVWLGQNVTILKGVTIGDNVIIGAGAIVTKDIPSNSVATGIPCRVVCTLEEYYNKRKHLYIKEGLDYARAIVRSGRKPTLQDFVNDWPMFVDGSNFTQYPYDYHQFNDKQFENWKRNYKAPFNGWDEFMKAVYSDSVL